MATCNPSTLLSDGAAFQNLSEEALRIATLQLLAEWALLGNPALDVTPSAILSRGANLQVLDDTGLGIVTLQSLCEISGG